MEALKDIKVSRFNRYKRDDNIWKYFIKLFDILDKLNEPITGTWHTIVEEPIFEGWLNDILAEPIIGIYVNLYNIPYIMYWDFTNDMAFGELRASVHNDFYYKRSSLPKPAI